ncbi:hypothetical protein DNI29_19585 [Hymenobacter sediminis]|uniref:hypothetical protein n=1 Tax=Hymenobacter sediminis TaxID=2218621 RepID=UPI000F4F6E6E|nr:hypothetical protein [Hymenobacter sediminis]RPD44904.1 hypothetical protein DNI29_19585 [Hymenobacter sediminis]
MRQFTDYFRVTTLLLLLLLGAANRNRLTSSLPLAARPMVRPASSEKPWQQAWRRTLPLPVPPSQPISQAQPL